MAKSHPTETLRVRIVGVNPEDWGRFVELPYFTAKWKQLGLSDDDLRALQLGLIVRPKNAPVVSGTGGLRKGRFAKQGSGRGKSDSYRIGYAYFEQFGVFALLTIYAKQDQANVTAQERRVIKRSIEFLWNWVGKG